MLLHILAHIAALVIILVQLIVIWFLAHDPNYGIWTAAAGLWLIKHERRRRSLILLDFDNFKVYNTEHGHSAADANVRIALRFRRGDGVKVVKRGGDEILLSCPIGHEAETIGWARMRLAEQGLTATAGVHLDATNVTAMLAAAEKAILNAKSANNKNTVIYLENCK